MRKQSRYLQQSHVVDPYANHRHDRGFARAWQTSPDNIPGGVCMVFCPKESKNIQCVCRECWNMASPRGRNICHIL